jgi:hypothetical protein
MLNLCGIVVANLKMATGRIFRCQESIQDIPELIPDIEKFLPVAIFKMAATIPHKFNIVRYHQNLICGYIMMISMSGINSGHHYLPTYQILMISDNVEFLRYYGGHFENGDR